MNLKRVHTAYLIIGVLLTAQIGVLFYNSGTVKGINKRADKLKIYAEAEREDETILPGDIRDRNGELLVETNYHTETETAEDGTRTDYTVRKTEYKDPAAYSQLLGYTGKRDLNPLAESEDQVVGERNDYRLMAFLDDNDYWGKNGLYSTTGIDGTKGQTVTLTIDDGLQEAVFEALRKEVDSSDEMGSAVVMDAQTGEVLSMVSFPSYDFNNLSQAKEDMIKDENNTNLEPAFPVSYKGAQTPGSIFKVLMAVSLLDHGIGDFTVQNKSILINNSMFDNVSDWPCYADIYNSGTLKIGENDEINLEHALNISSNVYFAAAAIELGPEKLQETASKFMIEPGENNYLKTDFGNIMYSWNPDPSVLAQTGIGQGYTRLTTIYASMIAQALANEGKMMQPYLINNLTDNNGKIVYEGGPKLLSQATSKSTARTVASYLRSTAKEACQLHGLSEVGAVFEEYQVAGKTGTAEIGEERELNNAWYVSFAPADAPRYVVVVNQCKTKKTGYQMMPVVAEIYQYLFENYQNSGSRIRDNS